MVVSELFRFVVAVVVSVANVVVVAAGGGTDGIIIMGIICCAIICCIHGIIMWLWLGSPVVGSTTTPVEGVNGGTEWGAALLVGPAVPP